MDSNCHDGPCPVPPHPDLIARQKSEILKVQGVANESTLKKLKSDLAFPDRPGRILGLNDGTIFPKSHSGKSFSIKATSKAALEKTPLRGGINVVLVLVDFQDVKMAAGAKQRFEELFFSKGKIPTGSVSEYYQEVSGGRISLTGDVIGPFTLSQSMAYYANGNAGMGWPEPNSMTMANEAVTAAEGKLNFNKYDNDGNGYIDVFCVVHAGTGAEQSGDRNNHIWSVKWVLPEPRKLNDVTVYGFLTIPEDARIGVCAHEIGHLLFGWPDLYDTDYSSSGIGNWCLMSFGSWGGGGDRPVHPSAWCKANQGWIDVINETENHKITLADVKSGKKTHRLWKNGDSNSTEYFLLENRQLTGYDESLPGDGLLVWHIDDSMYGNADESHPQVGLLQADGFNQLQAGNGSDAGDPFPGTANNRALNATSNPDSKAYSGADTFVSVTNIPASSSSMTFDITVKAITTPPGDGAFDPRMWYRLNNTLQGHALDVLNDGSGSGLVQMQRIGNFSGQFWQIVPNGAGTYALRTLFLGANRQLDVVDKVTPRLADAGPFTGQVWTIAPWGDGTWHLNNLYTGKEWYLDTMEGGPRVAMNQANIGRPTQRWTITPIRAITEPGF